MPKKTPDEQTPPRVELPLVAVAQVADDMITIDSRRYKIVLLHKQPFDVSAFAVRYTDVLDKYDFVVGDWGYDQLRLKGFYANDSRHATKGQTIATLMDYINEYCNFGCAYFVLQRLDAPAPKPKHKGRNERGRSRRRNNNNKKPYQERRQAVQDPAKKQHHAETVAPNQPRKRHFTIRQRESNEK
jgi:uncharacterized protein YutD